ncbi:MAG: hypothetical protein R3C09_19900 [Pirellulaceae bacterium]
MGTTVELVVVHGSKHLSPRHRKLSSHSIHQHQGSHPNASSRSMHKLRRRHDAEVQHEDQRPQPPPRYLKCDYCGECGQEVFRIDSLGRPLFATSFTPMGNNIVELDESAHTMNKAEQ